MNVTVVTGAATGIGRALCERLLTAGEYVVVVDINEREMAWVNEYEQALAFVADVSTEAGNSAMIDAAVEHFGGLDGAAFNAGVPRFRRCSNAVGAPWSRPRRSAAATVRVRGGVTVRPRRRSSTS